MRRLTEQEREALKSIGEPGAFVPEIVFVEFAALGWGEWIADDRDASTRHWEVTPAGRRALYLDTLARGGSP